MTGAAAASAAVVGVTRNAGLSAGPFTVSLGDGAATYTFGDSGDPGVFGGTPLPSVTTGGSSEILSMSSIFGDGVARFSTGGNATRVIGEPRSNEVYRTFDDETLSLENPVYIGLRFDLDDGEHFGFARIGGLTLFDLAYERQPGVPVQTQPGPYASIPSPAPIPLPAAIPLLGLALAGFGVVSRRRRHAA